MRRWLPLVVLAACAKPDPLAGTWRAEGEVASELVLGGGEARVTMRLGGEERVTTYRSQVLDADGGRFRLGWTDPRGERLEVRAELEGDELRLTLDGQEFRLRRVR